MAQTIVTTSPVSQQRDALASAAYRPAFPPAWAVPVAVGTLADALGDARTAAGARDADPWKARPRNVRSQDRPLVYWDRTVLHYIDARSHLGRAHARYQGEGQRWYASVGPGRIRFGSVDPMRGNRRLERDVCRRAQRISEHAGWHARMVERQALEVLAAAGVKVDPKLIPEAGIDPLLQGLSKREIMEWSAKSRSAMIDRLSTLDYEPLVTQGVPAMITLTLPGGWEEYAPDGQAFKRLVRTFVKRFERAWGRRMIGLWKLEFQHRGAPHLHALMVPPSGEIDGLGWRDWFAQCWASVVVSSAPALPAQRRQEDYHAMVRVHRHPTASADYAEGLRASDPRRVAVYFLKHSLLRDKEYQHVVPALWREPGKGPGRFWGYWGLQRADLAVPLTYDEAVQMARTLRRWQASKGATHRVRHSAGALIDRSTGEVVQARYRTVRRRVRSMSHTAGYVVLNDGPAAALLLADSVRFRKHDQQEIRRRFGMIDKA